MVISAKLLVLSLSLATALSQARKNHPALKRAAADLKSAQAFVESARGNEDWFLDLGVSGQLQRRDPVPGQPVQQIGADALSLRAELGRALPIGGRASLRVDGSYTRTNFALNLDTMGAPELRLSEATVYAPALSLNLNQPLLRGAGLRIFRAPLRRALTMMSAASLQEVATAALSLREVASAYYELAYAEAEKTIRSAAVHLAEEQLRLVGAQIQVGKAPSAASAEVLSALALRKEEALQAQRVLLERSIEVRRLLGWPLLPEGKDDLQLSARDGVMDTKEAPPVEPDLAEVLALAQASNPQLRQLASLRDAAAIEVEVTENGMLPQLDLSVGGSITGFSSELPGALSQMVSFRSFNLLSGLSFSLPLGRRTAMGARDAARAELRKAEVRQAEVLLQIQAAVALAHVAMRSARMRVEALAQSEEWARTNLEGERARYQVGRATSFDVLRRQEELALVRLRNARARADALSARVMLRSLTGELVSDLHLKD